MELFFCCRAVCQTGKRKGEAMFNRDDLNSLYFPLCEKAEHINARLTGDGVCPVISWIGSHSRKSSDGFYETDCYPIPVIEVKGLCDIEVDFDCICVNSKLSKQSALDFDYSLIDGLKFEVYGENDCPDGFYRPESGILSMLRRIEDSFETEIFFTFDMGSDSESKLYRLLDILSANGFYF